MATSPDRVRRALAVVTTAASTEARRVAQAAGNKPSEVRAALFAAVPLIVGDYADGAGSLAVEWYEELREDANPSPLFDPQPLALVTDDDVAAMIARTTEPLFDLEREQARVLGDIERELAASLDAMAAEIQREVAAGFRDTITGNTQADPAAVGWQRHARPDGCKFCVMLASRGAVYTAKTARFAAHTNCGCVAGPSFDPDAPHADVMQYVASRKRRSDAERAALREYLNEHFPDAPG